MGKFKYSEEEQKMNNVLKYQDDQLNELMLRAENQRNRRDAEIELMEEQLRSLGINPQDVKRQKNSENHLRLMVIPSWEKLCEEAEAVVGSNCELESIFSEAELASNESAIRQLRDDFNQVHKLDKIDITISAIAGIIGAAVDILLVGIPEKGPEGLEAAPLSDFIRKKFDEAFPEAEMQKLANSKESKVPFDAQDNRNTSEYVEGLSAYYHRLLSLGHDPLLGFVVGVFDIITGRMTTIDKTGKIVSQVMENYADRKESDIFAALAKQIYHFKSDITTSMGLPAPLMGLFNLFQFGSIGEYEQTVAEIVQGMYFEGYDFIHFCSMSIPVMITEVIVRISYSVKRIKEGNKIKDSIPFSLNREKHPKLATMLFIAHSGATAVNAGKVYFTKNPMAINYPQWVAFAKYSYKQLKWAIIEKPAAREAYISGKLAEDWGKIEDEVNSSFEEFSKGYYLVME
ncbi:hypothetical protein [Butyrivibrio sp. AE3009]|uniref:hypothetical protein n=1 Tax=Butyrivibrio sp. AE3009 TaxID=1280666 RepID=UPI0003B550BD|nr:hypothetical protein [Butyrivibrio sp. AE3009]